MSDQDDILIISDSEDENIEMITISDSEDERTNCDIQRHSKSVNILDSDNTDVESTHVNKKIKNNPSDTIQRETPNEKTNLTIQPEIVNVGSKRNDSNNSNIIDMIDDLVKMISKNNQVVNDTSLMEESDQSYTIDGEQIMFLEGNQIKDQTGKVIFNIVADNEKELEKIIQDIQKGISYNMVTDENQSLFIESFNEENKSNTTESIKENDTVANNKAADNNENQDRVNIEKKLESNEKIKEIKNNDNKENKCNQKTQDNIEKKSNPVEEIKGIENNNDHNKNNNNHKENSLNTNKNIEINNVNKENEPDKLKLQNNAASSSQEEKDPSKLLDQFCDLLNATLMEESSSETEPEIEKPNDIDTQLNAILNVLDDEQFMKELDDIESIQNSACDRLRMGKNIYEDITWVRQQLKQLYAINIRHINRSIRFNKPLVHYRIGNTIFKTVWVIGILMGSAIKTIKNEISFIVNDGDDSIKCLYTKRDAEKMLHKNQLINILGNYKNQTTKRHYDIEDLNVFMRATTSLFGSSQDKSKGFVLNEKHLKMGKYIAVMGNVSEYFEEKLIYCRYVERLNLQNYNFLLDLYNDMLKTSF